MGMLFRVSSIGQRNETMMNFVWNLTRSKCRVLQLGSKNPLLEGRSHQDTEHLFRVRSVESRHTVQHDCAKGFLLQKTPTDSEESPRIPSWY